MHIPIKIPAISAQADDMSIKRAYKYSAPKRICFICGTNTFFSVAGNVFIMTHSFGRHSAGLTGSGGDEQNMSLYQEL